MNTNELFDLYEKQYYHEVDRKDKFSASLNIPFAVIATVAGFIGFMLDKNSIEPSGFLWIAFCIFLGLALIFDVLSGFYLFKSLNIHSYTLLPTPKQSEIYRIQLIEHYSDKADKEILVERDMKEYFFKYYVEFSSANIAANDRRAYLINRLIYSSMFAVVFSILAFVPHQIDKAIKKPQISEAINPTKKDLTMSEDKPLPPSKTETKPEPSPPSPPPARSVKGDYNKPKAPSPPKKD